MPSVEAHTMTNGSVKNFDPFQSSTIALRTSLDGKPTTSTQTVLQQHCAFWDRDEDGIIWPLDTFRGFRDIGFNLFLSILSIFIIHSGFSYPSVLKSSYIPDPLFRVYLDGIDKCKHGSDSGTYDSRGYYQPSQFNSIFAKYAATPDDGLTVREMFSLISGQRVAMDPFGWFAAIFEWYTTVILTYNPKTGLCEKKHIRGIFDGSYFWHIKTMRESGNAGQLPGMNMYQGLECLLRGGTAISTQRA